METLLLWKTVANLCSAGQDFLLAWPLWGHTAPGSCGLSPDTSFSPKTISHDQVSHSLDLMQDNH